MSIKNTLYIILSLFLILVIVSAFTNNKGTSTNVYKDELVIHCLSDAKGLNPFTVSDATSKNYMILNIMESMLAFENESMKLVPVLAVSLPEIKNVGENIEVTYEIRPEATWDNGKPITVDDVLFSYKSVLCPKVNSDNVRPSIDFVKEIRTYADNPRKYTVVCSKNIGVLEGTGYELKILPEYVYDAKHLLRKYSIPELAVENPKCADDANVKEFSDFFNSQKTMRDPAFVQGSGAYRFTSWETGQRMVLERKKNWWGDKMNKINQYFEAYPKRLVFVTVNSYPTALTALKNEKIDFCYVTPVKDYVDLDNSPKFRKNFYKTEPAQLGYQIVCINQKDKILSDLKVRKALCYLTNVEQIVTKVLYGKGVRINSVILPMKKDLINPAIQFYPYDINAASKLLKEAGWKDTDGDGILDKIIDGQKTDFDITFTYNSGNSLREMVGLLMQRSFYQVGIKLSIKAMDWSLYQDELKKHNLQLWYQGWIASPGADDNKQLFHTSGANGGSNYGSFGNAKTDKLLDDIRVEMDDAKRKELLFQWQVVEHEQIPQIYLYVQKYRNCINNRFENIHSGSGVYPGVWFAGFKVKKGYKIED
jgi:peptide/nickel transport system substrate-binding protein